MRLRTRTAIIGIIIGLSAALSTAVAVAEAFRGTYRQNQTTKASTLHFDTGQVYPLVLPPRSDPFPNGIRVEGEGRLDARSRIIAQELHIERGGPALGLRRGLVVLVRFQDSDPLSNPDAVRPAFEATLADVSNYFEEVSLGAFSIQFDVVGPLTFPNSKTQCGGDITPAQMANALQGAGVIPDSYDYLLNVLQLYNDCGFSAVALQGGRYSNYNVDFEAPMGRNRSFAHELGHNLGLDHSSLLRCPRGQSTLVGVCAREGYQDYLDVMGISGNGRGEILAMHAWERFTLGWLPKEQVHFIDTPKDAGVYELSPLGTIDGVTALRIPKGKLNVLQTDPGPNQEYDFWVSFRQPIGRDIPDREYLRDWERGAMIHVAPRYPNGMADFQGSTRNYDQSFLVPTQAQGLYNMNGVGLLPGHTYRDTSSGVVVRVIKANLNVAEPDRSRLTVQVCVRGSKCPVLPMASVITLSTIYFDTLVNKPFPIVRAQISNGPALCTISPALPAGLNFSPTLCRIYGTPTQVTPRKLHTITATNAVGSGEATISFEIR